MFFFKFFQSFSKSLKKKLGSALVPVTPKRLMSKRKPVIATPFSKKCLFYGGDVQKLIMSENDKGFPAWNGCKNILIFNPKVIRVYCSIRWIYWNQKLKLKTKNHFFLLTLCYTLKKGGKVNFFPLLKKIFSCPPSQ